MELGVGVATSAMIAAPSPASTYLWLKKVKCAINLFCFGFWHASEIRYPRIPKPPYEAPHTPPIHVQTLCSRSTVGAPPRFPARTSPMVHASRHPRGAWCSATGAAVASVACGHVLISGEARSGRSVWELSGSACDLRLSSQIRPMCCSTQSGITSTAQGRVRETRVTTTN